MDVHSHQVIQSSLWSICWSAHASRLVARAAGSWGLAASRSLLPTSSQLWQLHERNEAIPALAFSWFCFCLSLPQASGCFDVFCLLEKSQGSLPIARLRGSPVLIFLTYTPLGSEDLLAEQMPSGLFSASWYMKRLPKGAESGLWCYML